MTPAKMVVVRHLFTILDPLAVLVGDVLAALGVSGLQKGEGITTCKRNTKIERKESTRAAERALYYIKDTISHYTCNTTPKEGAKSKKNDLLFHSPDTIVLGWTHTAGCTLYGISGTRTKLIVYIIVF